MQHPDFYSKVASIKLYDPLSDFLGVLKNAEVEIKYLDCVKLAGHSCPTVAGTYLMSVMGLGALYRDTLPQRSMVKVEMRENESVGVTWVTGNIISFILGAGGIGGLKSIQGNFRRNNLLFYGASISSEIKLTRLDTMQCVDLSYDPSIVKADEKMMLIMETSLKGIASEEEKKMFQTLWQDRVKEILLSTDIYDKLILISKE